MSYRSLRVGREQAIQLEQYANQHTRTRISSPEGKWLAGSGKRKRMRANGWGEVKRTVTVPPQYVVRSPSNGVPVLVATVLTTTTRGLFGCDLV
ncbi:hypothetical protein ZHAS_00005720 [Anopheles sinensis]|uniref:Uncharacterized protein n=1 Tax=Anopheles sinensis TaxID=74873 RepID=A0A084VK71_ANOSI|nr:hypothetical protein ZHAS_00005720 [Anopheles sinensis]